MEESKESFRSEITTNLNSLKKSEPLDGKIKTCHVFLGLGLEVWFMWLVTMGLFMFGSTNNVISKAIKQ